jgi:hypothetical protein
MRRVPTEISLAEPAIDAEPVQLMAPSVLQGIGNTIGGSPEPLLSTYPSNSDEDDDPMSIPELLYSLHVTYPRLNYLQYGKILKQRGIRYAINASGLDEDFFVNRIGMTEYAAGIFLERARKQCLKERREKATRKMRSKKRARLE